MKMIALLTVAVAVAAAGCVTRKDLTKLSLGMSKAEVIAELGKPKYDSVQGRAEYLTYESERSYFDGQVGGDFLYVRLIDGRVESFGQRGDFDSTKDPTLQVITRSTIDATISGDRASAADIESELRRLDLLRKAGLISDADYESAKAKLLDQIGAADHVAR